MALEKLEYPVTSPTNSWLPSRNPSYDGARDKREWGVLPQMSSGNKAYLYEEGISCHYFTRSYKRMPESEKTSFLTFKNAALGAKIKYTDQLGAAHTVTFWSWQDEFEPSAGDRWSWTFTLREEL